MKADVEGEIRVKCYMPSCSGETAQKEVQRATRWCLWRVQSAGPVHSDTSDVDVSEWTH